jgi:hypothetical protein
MQKLLIFIVCCFLWHMAEAQISPAEQIAQKIGHTASGTPQTLVYLQTSKGIFQRGEQIWFKAYVMDPQSWAPSALDTTLYVQLRSADSARVVSEEKILIDNGFASGYIATGNTLPGNDYLLAAFTANSILKDTAEFKAFRRLKIAAAHSSSPPTPSVVTDPTRLAFFPEGGNLVSDIPNVVAFKASTTGGLPVQVDATFLENGRQVMNLSTNKLGMGKFEFTPKSSAEYTVQLAQSRQIYPLPHAMPAGLVLHLLEKTEDRFTFLLTKNRQSSYEQLYVSAQSRGIVCAVYQGKMTGDSLRFSLPANKLPTGIVQVTVYDQALRPLAERLIYAHSGKDLVTQVTLSRTTFRPKDKVKINIKVTDPTGTPVAAHLGVSVYDSFYQNPADRLNIVSYTQLHSQIRGAIPNPDYYFDPGNKDRDQAMDLLLLTQGWRRYIWDNGDPASAATGKMVLSNKISGHLTGKGPFPPMLLAFGPDGSGIQHPVPVRQDGHFALSIENMLLSSMYLKPLGDQQVTARTKIMIDDPFSQVRQALAAKRIVSPVFTVQPDGTNYRSALSRSIVLDEFVVTGKGRTYSDRYMESLGSLAKFSWNTDFVGACNWLNCISCGNGKKPVEGVSYSKFKDGRPSQHGSFNPNDVVKEPYKYPVYTEEELMAKFNLYRARGYQVRKQFYEPDYEHAPLETAIDDQRNTLLWNPDVITDQNGEASLEFYCSDITGTFIGNIEGLDGNGRLTATTFRFTVEEGKNK